jgi:hypothetical protein
MNEITTTPLYQNPPVLGSRALQTLVRRFQAESGVSTGWKPKRRIETYVAEAFHLAALIDESRSPLLRSIPARELRERALAVRAADDEARSLRANRSRARKARATRRTARHYAKEVLDALHYLATAEASETLHLQLRRINRRPNNDDSFAGELFTTAELARPNQAALERLGLSAKFLESGWGLGQDLHQISADQKVEVQRRMQATAARDRILFTLKQRLESARATLRYVHRGDIDFLRRLAH